MELINLMTDTARLENRGAAVLRRRDLRARSRDATVELVPRPPINYRIESTKAWVTPELSTGVGETEHAKY